MTNTWFCTIFDKSNNKAVTTFPTEWKFTEKEAKDYFIKSGLMKEKGSDLSKEFDEKYRILIGK